MQFLHSLLHFFFSSANIPTKVIYQYFQNSKDPIIAKVYRKFIEPERRHLPLSTMAGLSRLCTETKYSFFCTNIRAIPLLMDVPCKVIEIPEISYTSVSSMIIMKRSPYKKILNRVWIHLSVLIIIINYEQHYICYTNKDV